MPSGPLNISRYPSGGYTNYSSVYVTPPTRFLCVLRTHLNTHLKPVVSQERRPLDNSKLRKLRDDATVSLINKLNLIPLYDSDDQVLNNYNLQMRVKELQRCLQKCDMAEVFQILQFNPNYPFVTLPQNLNLLEH